MKTGVKELNRWADNIAKKAGMSFNIVQKDGIPDFSHVNKGLKRIIYNVFILLSFLFCN